MSELQIGSRVLGKSSKVLRSAIMWNWRAGTVVETVHIPPSANQPEEHRKNYQEDQENHRDGDLKKILKTCKMNPCYLAMVNNGPPQKGSLTIRPFFVFNQTFIQSSRRNQNCN
eukprot:scaffold2913_cov181-Ochromonas_danica.AAC.36